MSAVNMCRSGHVFRENRQVHNKLTDQKWNTQQNPTDPQHGKHFAQPRLVVALLSSPKHQYNFRIKQARYDGTGYEEQEGFREEAPREITVEQIETECLLSNHNNCVKSLSGTHFSTIEVLPHDAAS